MNSRKMSCLLPIQAIASDSPVKNAALSDPFHSDIFIKNWASIAVSDAMSFDFHNHETELKDAQKYFTQGGWESFDKALNKARIVEMVVKNKQIASATITASPMIARTKTVGEHFIWEVEVPIVITYTDGSRMRSDKLNFLCIITRSSEPQNDDGIGIIQLVGRPA